MSEIAAASPRWYELFVATPPHGNLDGPLGWLARKFSLDVNGPTLLTRRVAVAMKFGALTLLIVLAFELLAWCLCFNAMIHADGDIMTADGLTVLAILLGTMVATVIFVFEQQLFTADLDEGGLGKWIGIAGRVALIAASTFITSRPVELLVFRGPISARTHDEQTFVEAFRRWQQIEEEEKSRLAQAEERKKIPDLVISTSAAGMDLQAATKKVNDAEGALSSARIQRNRVVAALNAASARVVGLQGEIRSRSAALARAEKEAALDPALAATADSERRALRRAEAAYRDARADESRYRQQLPTFEVAVRTAEERLGGEVAKRRAAVEGVDREQDKRFAKSEAVEERIVARKRDLGDYMTVVKQHGASREKVSHAGFEYRLAPLDFHGQLRVLQDLRTARPAKWVGTSPAMKKKLKDEFDLPYATSAQDFDQLRYEAALFEKIYWAAWGMAAFIPMLVLLTKLLLPRDIRAYYSRRMQASVGNPEALLIGDLDVKEPKRS